MKLHFSLKVESDVDSGCYPDSDCEWTGNCCHPQTYWLSVAVILQCRRTWSSGCEHVSSSLGSLKLTFDLGDCQCQTCWGQFAAGAKIGHFRRHVYENSSTAEIADLFDHFESCWLSGKLELVLCWMDLRCSHRYSMSPKHGFEAIYSWPCEHLTISFKSELQS